MWKKALTKNKNYFLTLQCPTKCFSKHDKCLAHNTGGATSTHHSWILQRICSNLCILHQKEEKHITVPATLHTWLSQRYMYMSSCVIEGFRLKYSNVTLHEMCAFIKNMQTYSSLFEMYVISSRKCFFY